MTTLTTSQDTHSSRQFFPLRRGAFLAFLLLAFCFRFWYGLSLGLSQGDPQQVYLIGLKCYLTRSWPYFGPDVVTHVQISGALQGLVIALPLALVPIPESPFVFLNLLSLFGLCLLAEYCVRHLPKIPPWLIRTWIMTAPWTLGQSTHVYNPSYVLVGSVAFFLGALETYSRLRLGWIRPVWANFLMGVGLGWVMQFHLSYVILFPYLAASAYCQLKEHGAKALRTSWSFAVGALATGIFILPTIPQFGGNVGLTGQTASMIHFNIHNLPIRPDKAFDIIARFLSFASFEIPRFLGPDTASRFAFVKAYPWLAPVVLLLIVVGTLQPVVMLVIGLFGGKPRTPAWAGVRQLCFMTIGLLYLSFAFSHKPPHAHTFYVTFPIAMLFSLYCWNEFLQSKRGQLCASLLLTCNILFHVVLTFSHHAHHPWALDRQAIERALTVRDYHEFGERRPGAFY
jgi:hypothetical protein